MGSLALEEGGWARDPGFNKSPKCLLTNAYKFKTSGILRANIYAFYS